MSSVALGMRKTWTGLASSIGTASTTTLKFQSRSENLWERAFKSLNEEDKNFIDSHQLDKRTTLEYLFNVIEEKKKICLDRRWRFKKPDGEVVILRDIMDRMVKAVNKFKDIGDVAVQYDPGHAVLPWVGVRLVLQGMVNDVQTFNAASESLEQISSLIARFAMIEDLYLRVASAATQLLTEAIVNLYTAVLRYLLKAKQYYSRNTGERVARSLIQTAETSVEVYLKAIVNEEAKVNQLAQLIDSHSLQTVAMYMHGGFTGIHDKLDSLSHQFGELKMNINTRPPKVDRKQILAWLDAVLTDEDYENALSARLDGTCDWILQRPEFQIWSKPDAAYDSNKVLWIHGPPGFGKTVLCAKLVEHLSIDTHLPVAYFFCVGANDAKRQPRAIVRSWVAQLVNQNEDALDVARDFYNGKEARRATDLDIWQVFREVNSNIGTCFFAIDGYDECLERDYESQNAIDGRARFLRELISTVKSLGCRVLLVSRNEPDIKNELKNDSEGSDPDLFLEYEITRQDTKDDIQSFSHSIIQQGIPNKPSPLKQEIASEAALKCDGMFLWIKLMHIRLSPGKNTKQLREIVRTTPPGLDQAYERDVRNINNLPIDERERAIAILRWTLFAQRPLTVREMTEALLIRDDDYENTFPQDDLPDEWDEYYTNDQIKRLCGSLIELRSTEMNEPIKDQTIQFVHFSVKEYLLRSINTDLSIQYINFSNAASEQSYLARACLRYLCFDNFRLEYHSTREDLQAVTDTYAFYAYAAQSWFYNLVTIGGFAQDHLIPKESLTQELITSVNRLFDPTHRPWLFWSEVMETTNDSLESFQESCRNGYPGPQYYAAMLGLTWVLEYLRAEGIDLSAKGGRFGNALQVATINGHMDSIRYLLSNDVDINLEGGAYGSAIVAAAAAYDVRESPAIVQLLIEKGANIKSRDENAQTALHLSSRFGTLPVVRLLLENGADVHSVSDFGQTALHAASVYGHKDVVELLIDYGSDVNHTDGDKWTALHVAAYNGHASVCQRLLDSKADVNFRADRDLTPLHEAANQGHETVVALLLNSHADINSVTSTGGTALHLAAFRGHHATVRLLIARGANVDAKNINGWTPLHETISNAKTKEHEITVETLLAKGANVHAVNKTGETALHLAICEGSKAIVDILLRNKANCNLPDTDQWTPVHAAVTANDSEILELLLKSNADVNVISESGWTPLLFAADRGHEKIVRQLIKAGANLNQQTGMNCTALHKALYHGSSTIIELLLSHGADPLLVDGFGRSCMDWASSDPVTLELMRPYCNEYKQTDPSIAHSVLRSSIAENVAAIRSTTVYELKLRWINQIGRCLLLLHDEDAACDAFEIAIMSPSRDADPPPPSSSSSSSLPTHYAICSTCLNEKYIQGERFLCDFCAEVDVCTDCMAKHRARPFLPTCRGHRFVKVPRDGWVSLEERGLGMDDVLGTWLAGVEETYT